MCPLRWLWRRGDRRALPVTHTARCWGERAQALGWFAALWEVPSGLVPSKCLQWGWLSCCLGPSCGDIQDPCRPLEISLSRLGWWFCRPHRCTSSLEKASSPLPLGICGRGKGAGALVTPPGDPCTAQLLPAAWRSGLLFTRRLEGGRGTGVSCELQTFLSSQCEAAGSVVLARGLPVGQEPGRLKSRLSEPRCSRSLRPQSCPGSLTYL